MRRGHEPRSSISSSAHSCSWSRPSVCAPTAVSHQSHSITHPTPNRPPTKRPSMNGCFSRPQEHLGSSIPNTASLQLPLHRFLNAPATTFDQRGLNLVHGVARLTQLLERFANLRKHGIKRLLELLRFRAERRQ